MIEAVILYSTKDSRFYSQCITQLIKAGVRCHVVSYTHLWNGILEDRESLLESQKQFDKHELVNHYCVDWKPGESPWYWEGLGRFLGTQRVLDSCEYVLYIDIDEIVDSQKLTAWIEKGDYRNYDVVRLTNYWYWREPIYQAIQTEDSVVLLRTSIAKQLPFKEGSRELYVESSRNILRRAESQDPIVHHFSWVGTEEDMLKKVENWGHTSERDWISLVHKEFSTSFTGTDFVHGYSYNVVKNKFNL